MPNRTLIPNIPPLTEIISTINSMKCYFLNIPYLRRKSRRSVSQANSIFIILSGEFCWGGGDLGTRDQVGGFCQNIIIISSLSRPGQTLKLKFRLLAGKLSLCIQFLGKYFGFEVLLSNNLFLSLNALRMMILDIKKNYRSFGAFIEVPNDFFKL